MAVVRGKAFPLTWPTGQPRSKVRATSRLGDRTLAAALAVLKSELTRLAAQFVIVSTNVPLKDNGEPYSNPGKMADPGVAVYFQLKGRGYCLACDRWKSVEENLYSVAKHIEAMRGMDRWGVGSVEQNFAGFRELPASVTLSNWWDVLGITRDADRDAIVSAHRKLAMNAHPDRGGFDGAMQQLNVARDQALRDVAKD